MCCAVQWWSLDVNLFQAYEQSNIQVPGRGWLFAFSMSVENKWWDKILIIAEWQAISYLLKIKIKKIKWLCSLHRHVLESISIHNSNGFWSFPLWAVSGIKGVLQVIWYDSTKLMVSAPMRHNKTLANFSRERRYFASSEKLSVLIEAV